MNVRTVLFITAFTTAFLLAGCATHPVAPHVQPQVFTHPGETPPSLTHVAKWLDALIVISAIGIGVGIALFFFAPVAHRASIILAGTAGAVEGSALLLRVSLWMIPWIAIGLVTLALAALGYEIYVKVSKSKSLPPLESFTTPVIGSGV